MIDTKDMRVKFKGTFPWPITEYTATIKFDKAVSVEEFKRFLKEEFPEVEIVEKEIDNNVVYVPEGAIIPTGLKEYDKDRPSKWKSTENLCVICRVPLTEQDGALCHVCSPFGRSNP